MTTQIRSSSSQGCINLKKVDSRFLKPIFSNFSESLTVVNNWVVCDGKKVPHDPTSLNSKASVKDPSTWRTYLEAKTAFEEGGWMGIGFVLNGNGIAGIDLDKCVIDGKPKPEALEILKDLNVGYIELSPSGTGLRGFGYAKNLVKGVSGILNGVSVELYTNHRFLTVTGHTLKNEPFNELTSFHDLAKKIRSKLTEDTNSNSFVSSVSYVSTVMDFPVNAIPFAVGQRQRKLFEVARWVKGREPDATKERQLEIVKCWHSKFLHIIGTKEFEASWTDFRYSLARVKQPYGATLQSCLSNLPPPPNISELHLYGAKAVHLMRICMALQIYHGIEPIYLSCRTAGELIDYNHTDAAKLLQIFVSEGWLIEIHKGVGKKASKYKLNIDWS